MILEAEVMDESVTEEAILAPFFSTAESAEGLRSKTVTDCPPASKLLAIWPPIFPSPMKATDPTEDELENERENAVLES